MAKRATGLNRFQKAARRPGEKRLRGADIDVYVALAESRDAEDRLQAAANLCPCHVRRRLNPVWAALYRLLEDSDVRVRRAAWHTLEDGGRPDDPALDAVIDRAVVNETDKMVRGFVEQFAAPRRQRQQLRDRVAGRSAYDRSGRCDFCGESGPHRRQDLDTPISSAGRTRAALVCRRCDARAER